MKKYSKIENESFDKGWRCGVFATLVTMIVVILLIWLFS